MVPGSHERKKKMDTHEIKKKAEIFSIIAKLIEDNQKMNEFLLEDIKQLEEDIANTENPSHWTQEDLKNKQIRVDAYLEVSDYLARYK